MLNINEALNTLKQFNQEELTQLLARTDQAKKVSIQPLQDVIKAYITNTVIYYHWNISEAARNLGVTRTTCYKYLNHK